MRTFASCIEPATFLFTTAHYCASSFFPSCKIDLPKTPPGENIIIPREMNKQIELANSKLSRINSGFFNKRASIPG
jgi:hypothetical protein